MALNKEQFRTILRKNPAGLTCFFVCLVMAGFTYWRSDAIPDAEVRLETNASLVSRLNQNLSNSAHLKEQYDQLIEAATGLETRVIKASAIADNQRYFYRIETSTATKLIDLRQTTTEVVPVPGSFFRPVGFTVVVQGDFHHTLSFLRALEGGNYFTRISSISLVPSSTAAPGESDAQVAMLTMSINLDLLGVP